MDHHRVSRTIAHILREVVGVFRYNMKYPYPQLKDAVSMSGVAIGTVGGKLIVSCMMDIFVLPIVLRLRLVIVGTCN